MSRADSPTRLCENVGCGRPLRARGACSTHYNQVHQPERHRKVAVHCARCGRESTKDATRHRRYENLFCSMECRTAHQLADPQQRERFMDARRRQAHGPWSRRTYAARRLRKAAAGIKGWGIWSAGPCAHCGETFVRHSSTTPTPWCSKPCRNRARARRHKEGGTYGRLEVFKRDRWRCHLCGKLTDRTKRHPHPKAPTIDHLIPRADGGEDTLANVRTAHSLCNSYRRQFGTVQLLLFGEVA